VHGLISNEQAMFGEAVRRFAEREYGFGPAPHRLAFDRSRLARLGELGCLSLAIPEDLGGFGGPIDAMVAMASLSPALPPEPVVSSGIHAAGLIAATASSSLAESVLPGIAEGRIVAAVADLEGAARYDRTYIAATAQREAAGYRLDGEKPMVPFGADADLLVVSTVIDNEPALFLVESSATGLERQSVSRIDGMRAADVTLSNCSVPATARLDAMPATAALEQAADIAMAAQLGEMVGLMDAMIAATVDYASTRKQFGTALSTFQALQHRIADMWIGCEETRSLAAAAAHACAENGKDRSRTISAAMIIACNAARRVGNETIQIHGGIGITDELIVSHWYRRLWALQQELGDRRCHLDRLSSMAG
jgi:alkylation response protein AidB-like acyl-CoA dehydrogenase